MRELDYTPVRSRLPARNWTSCVVRGRRAIYTGTLRDVLTNSLFLYAGQPSQEMVLLLDERDQ